MEKKIEQLRNKLENTTYRSAWDNGVKQYMFMLLDRFKEYYNYDNNTEWNEQTFLNGADNWKQYAEGGGGLCYNYNICVTLCTKSEQKRLQYGAKQPNKNESWIDVEARAFYQAWIKLNQMLKEIN